MYLYQSIEIDSFSGEVIRASHAVMLIGVDLSPHPFLTSSVLPLSESRLLRQDIPSLEAIPYSG